MRQQTSRGPVLGRLVAAYKKILKRLIDPYMREHHILASRFEAGEKRLDFIENWINHHALQRLDQADGRLNQADGRLDQAERGLNELLELGDELIKRMDSIAVLLNRRQEGLETRLDGMEKRQESTDGVLEETDYKYKSILNKLETLRSRFDALAEDVPDGALEGSPRLTRGAWQEGLDYLGFENRFRGEREEIKKRQSVYLSVFSNNPSDSRIIDIGCGRGEFLELLKEKGIEATGVDSNHSMIACCRGLGLDCEESEAISFLHAQRDASLGGIVAFQFIEHLSTGSLLEFVGLCGRKLKPGGHLVLETPNPTCLTVFSGSFYVDPTHTRPVHPEFIKFVVESSGLSVADTWFLNSPEEKLSMVSCPADRDTEGLLNENFARLNSFLYSAPDYAVIAKKA